MPHPSNIGIYQPQPMKQPLSSFLFFSEQIQQAPEDTSVLADIGKTITDTLEPLTKQVKQIGNDVKVIQQAQGQKKQEPTNARSTSGATKPATTSIPKGPGTISPGSGRDNGQDQLSARIDDLTGKVDKIVSLIEQREFGEEVVKLYKVLFEQMEYSEIGAADWSTAFLDAHKRKPYNDTISEIVTTGITAFGLSPYSENQKDAKGTIIRFVQESLPYLTQAVGEDAVSVSFLGAGAIGVAFLVKDSDEHEFVFKIETESESSVETKKKKIPGFNQQRSGEPAGASQPMIYDHGSFRVFNNAITLNWFLTQKLETTNNKYDLANILPYSLFSKLNDLFFWDFAAAL